MTFDPELLPLQPRGYDQPGTKPLELRNNGHTGKMPRLQGGESFSCNLTGQGEEIVSELLNSDKAPSVNLEVCGWG